MASDGELPPPSSGVFLEVSFRRLLASCEQIIAGDDKGREDLRSWRSSPVFHHYVETLEEQLTDLGSAAGSRIEASLMQRYRARVKQISGQLGKPDLGPYQFDPRSAAVQPALPAARTEQQLGSRPQPVQPSAAPSGQQHAPAKPPSPLSLSAAAKDRMAVQSNLQESLTDELATLAASLKSSTLAVEGRLRERAELLESTEAALDKSAAQAKQSAAKATQIHKQGRMTFCFKLLVLLLICSGFAGMVVFIRLTRLLGYKAPAPRDPPPPPLPESPLLEHPGELVGGGEL